MFDWDDVAAVSLRLPGSWFPYPGAAATIGYGVLTLLSQEVEPPPHEESTIRIAFTGGASKDLPVTHAPGGYWRRAIARAELLIGQFIDNPATRALLDRPEHIMRRYIAARAGASAPEPPRSPNPRSFAEPALDPARARGSGAGSRMPPRRQPLDRAGRRDAAIDASAA